MEEFDYFSPGDRFGDYVIVKLLGKGGMGAVYLAKSPDSGKLYAIKVMVPPDGPQRHEWRQRFVQEAEFAMRIRHPNLISVYDVGEDPATEYCYIIMDYVPGGSLSDRIKAQGKLDIRTAIDITIKIASALDVVHKAGIVHRDVKPDNIMFDADGSPKLSDLGIAKVSGRDDDTNVTKTGMMLGTPAYMSPEQMMNSHEVDARADIYSLGMVLYEMLTGRRPNDTSTIVQLLAKAIQGEELPDVRTVRPEVSVAVSYVLSKMVAVKPEERPASAVEVARLLYDAATGKLLVKPAKAMPSPSRKGPVRLGGDAMSRSGDGAKGGGVAKWIVAALGAAALCAAAFFVARSLNAPKKDGRGPAVVTNTIERVVRDAPLVVTNTIVREIAHVVTNTIERIARDAPVVVTNTMAREIAHVVTNVVNRSDFTASREVPLASAPESLRKDLERLRNIYARRKGNGRLVFGRLMVEDGAVNDVATWTWLNGDGTFTAAAIMAARNGLLFLKHGYEPLCVRVDEAKLPWNGDVAIDVGTVTLRRLPVDKTATFVLTPHLPNGVQSGMLTLNIDNYSPCGDDWGTRGRERRSCRVKSVPFRDGERISIAGCSPARYKFRLEATGCQAFGGDAVNLIQGENDVGERSMLLARTARFAVRKRDERGSEWMRLNINVDGNASLRINGMKDSWNNTYRIGLDGYRADAADSLKASFGFSPNTFEDLGEMAVEEYERRERDGMEISPVSTYGSTMVTFSPGHIYRHRNRHWGCDMLIAFEAYEAPVPPAGAAGNQKGRKNADRNAELAVEGDVMGRFIDPRGDVYRVKRGKYTWEYRLNSKGEAVLTSGSDAPCISPRPEGKVVVPERFGKHKVVAVGEKAFIDCDNLTEIVLSEGIEGIVGWYSFTRCVKLKKVKLPRSLRYMGGWSFESCSSITSFNFANCVKANVRGGATEEDYDFFGCTFAYNRNLQSIYASAENPRLLSVDGVLYSKDKKTLLAYPKARKKFSIIPGVKKIAGCALSSCSLRHVKIPDGVEEIGSCAFEYNDGYMETVEFPNSLKKIGNEIFKDTRSLRKVVFHGDAPKFEHNPFGNNSSDFFIEVERGSKGWNGPRSTDLPAKWPLGAGADARRIRYIK